MKKPVGPLGWTAEERAEYARTGKWPEHARDVEVPDGPPGLSLTSTNNFEDGFDGTAGEALLLLASLRPKHVKPGPQSKADEDFLLGWKCFQEAERNEERARRLFAERLTPRADPPVASKRFTNHFLKDARRLGLLKPKA